MLIVVGGPEVCSGVPVCGCRSLFEKRYFERLSKMQTLGCCCTIVWSCVGESGGPLYLVKFPAIVDPLCALV